MGLLTLPYDSIMTGPASPRPCQPLLSCSAAARAPHGSPYRQKAHSFTTVSVAGVCLHGEAWVSPHPLSLYHLQALGSQSAFFPAANAVSLCFLSDCWNNLPAGQGAAYEFTSPGDCP